jgi:hypothetical protein
MAAPKKRVKVKEHEKLTDSNIARVIELLNPPIGTKAITKKEACEILNISYNTTRLGSIIDNYNSRMEMEKKRYEANRGKPASEAEIKTIINEYLEGATVSEIAKGIYRRSAFVKSIIDEVGVPQKIPGENYFNFGPLPDQCVSETFEPGEIVWSAKYQSAAEVIKQHGQTRDGKANLYQIYIYEKFEQPEVLYVAYSGRGGFNAYQPAYELGRLKHLEKYGVDLTRKF